MKFHEPYTIRTWESTCGRVLIEREILTPKGYVLKVWGLDPEAFIMGEEVPRQWGWQKVAECDTLNEAQAMAATFVDERG